MIDQDLQDLAAQATVTPEFAPQLKASEIEQRGTQRARRTRRRRVTLGGMAAVLVALVAGTVLVSATGDQAEEFRTAGPPPATATPATFRDLSDTVHVTATVLHAEETLPDSVDLWVWIDYSDEAIEDSYALDPDGARIEDGWELLYQEAHVASAQPAIQLGGGVYASELELLASEDAAQLIATADVETDYGGFAATPGDYEAVPCENPCPGRPEFMPPDRELPDTGAAQQTNDAFPEYSVEVVHSATPLSDHVDLWVWIDYEDEALEDGWERLYQKVNVVAVVPLRAPADGPRLSLITLGVPVEAGRLIQSAADAGILVATTHEPPIEPCGGASTPCPDEPDFVPSDITWTTEVADGDVSAADVPLFVIDNELDVAELVAALADHGQTFIETPIQPADTDWRNAVAEAHGFEPGSSFDDTYVVRGRLTSPQQPVERDVWLVALRGLEMYGSGPYGPNNDEPEPANTEFLVFVDAATGEFISGSTFR